MSAIPIFDPFRATTGVLGNFFNAISLLLPWWLTFRKIRHEQSSDGVSVLSYTTQLLSSSVWILFSSHDPGNSFFLVVISGLSLCVNSTYTAIHFHYAGDVEKRRTIYFLLSKVIVGGCIVLMDDVVVEGSSYNHFLFTGIMAATAGISCSIPTILTMKKAIHYENSVQLSFWSAICSLLGYVSWILYGIYLKNVMIYVSNLFGLVIAIGQLVLLYIYPQIASPSAVVEASDEISVYLSTTSSPTPSLLTPPSSTSSSVAVAPLSISEIGAPPAAPRRWWWWVMSVVGVVAVAGYVFLV